MNKTIAMTLLAFNVLLANQVDLLLDQLEQAKDYKIKMASALKLGKVADGSVAHFMLESFRNQSNELVRLSILQGVSQIPDHRILAPLLHLKNSYFLKAKEQNKVNQTFWSFKNAVNSYAWNQVFHLSHDDQLKSTSLWLLSVIQFLPIKDLIHSYLDSSNENIKYHGIIALGLIGERKDLHLIDSMLGDKNSPKIQSALLFAKGRLESNSTHMVQLNKQIHLIEPQSFTPFQYDEYLKLIRVPSQIEQSILKLYPSSVTQGNQKLISFENPIDLPYFKVNAAYLDSIANYGKDLSVYRQKIQSNSPLFLNCHREALNDQKDIYGHIIVNISVKQSGLIDKVDFVEDTIKSKAIERCFKKIIESTKFESTVLQSIEFQYSFYFLKN